MWYLNNLVNIDTIPEKLKEDKLLKQAFDVAKFLALNKDEQLAYQLDLKAKLDYQNVMEYAREYAKEQGREEGIKEGIKEGEIKGLKKGAKEEKIKIAKSLLLAQVAIKIISETTGLTLQEIEKLK